MRYLIEKCHVDAEATGYDDRSPLHYACQNGSVDIVQYLIEKCHVDLKAESGDNGNALHCACSGGHLDIVEYLMSCHIDAEAKTYDGSTPLYYAIENGHLNIVQYLIEVRNVDTKATLNNGKTVLHHACDNSYFDTSILQYLIENDHVDIEATDKAGMTALHWASRCGRMDTLKILKETCNANTEATDNDGWTPLHHASKIGLLEIVQYLIEECHVDVSVQNGKGQVAYDLSRINNYNHVTNYFIQLYNRTANVHSVTNGTTMLTEHLWVAASAQRSSNHLPSYANDAPTTTAFPIEYLTSDDLPWYAIVIGSQDSKNAGLKESSNYRNIRNRCKHIPLEIMYYKLLLHFQQQKGTTRKDIPTHEDQLLFVYADQNVFRPIHLKEIPGKGAQNARSPREIRDWHVSADIKKLGEPL